MITPEEFIQNSELLTDIFGQVPKFHDGEIISLNLEVSSTVSYPKMRLLIDILHFGKHYHIVVEFNEIIKNSFENFGNQNSVWEMNFEKQENVLCRIEGNCGLSAELECKTVKIISVKMQNTNRKTVQTK